MDLGTTLLSRISADEVGAAERAALDAALEAALERWPEVVVDRGLWFDLIESYCQRQGLTARQLDKVDVGELYLAAGCASEDPAALRAIEQAYFAGLHAALAPMRVAEALRDDVIQQLRSRLLIPRDGRPPRIVDYAGGGRLKALVATSAKRAVISALRQSRRTELDASVGDRAVARANPEVSSIKNEHRRAFKQALQQAFRELSPHARELLKLRYVDGNSVEELSVMFDEHRTSTSRRLSKVRAEVATMTRRILRATLSGDRAGLDSLMAIVDNQFELSLSRVLAD